MIEHKNSVKISAVINTKNSAETLRRCLSSLMFVDQIVVVDMESTDNTLEIAKDFSADIFPHKDVQYVEPARNFAVSKAKGEWVLVIDADEEVPPQLAQKILAIVEDKNSETFAYFLPRKNIIFDRWIEKTGWWPDYQLRLFRRGAVQWEDTIHAAPQVSGRCEELAAKEEWAIRHHHYQTIEQYIERLNRYSTIELTSGSVASFSTSPAKTIKTFWDEFFRRCFAEKGIEEGMHGLSLSYLQSFYQLSVVLKSWQQHGFKTTDPQNVPRDIIAGLRSSQRDLNYWIADWQVQHTNGLMKLWWQLRRRLKR